MFFTRFVTEYEMINSIDKPRTTIKKVAGINIMGIIE